MNPYLEMENELGPARTAAIMLQDARHLLIHQSNLSQLAKTLGLMLEHHESVELPRDLAHSLPVQLLFEALQTQLSERKPALLW